MECLNVKKTHLHHMSYCVDYQIMKIFFLGRWSYVLDGFRRIDSQFDRTSIYTVGSEKTSNRGCPIVGGMLVVAGPSVVISSVVVVPSVKLTTSVVKGDLGTWVLFARPLMKKLWSVHPLLIQWLFARPLSNRL